MSAGRRTVGSVFDGFHGSSLPTDIGPDAFAVQGYRRV